MIIQLALRIIASEALGKKIHLPVMPEPGGGHGGHWPPEYLADQLNLFLSEGQIIPTNYYWHPQCFSPSGITAFNFEYLCMYCFAADVLSHIQTELKHTIALHCYCINSSL